MSTTPATVPVTVVTALEQVVREHGIQSINSMASVRDAYAPHFASFTALVEEARSIPANAPKAARAMRLELRAIRSAAETTRKKLKEDSLLRGRAIDGMKAVLDYQLVPIEDALEEIEKAEERAEEARRAALKATRTRELAPYVRDPGLYDLGAMPEADWQSLITGAKVAHKLQQEAEAKVAAERQAAERKAEEERAKRAAAEAAERARLKAENERLMAAAAKAREEREAAERKAAEEHRKAVAERDRQIAEHQEKVRQEQAARLKVERELAEQAKAALDRIAAENKAEADRIAAEKAAARKAARAPERQRLATFAASVRALSVPTISDAALAEKIHDQVTKLASWIDAEASKLS